MREFVTARTTAPSESSAMAYVVCSGKNSMFRPYYTLTNKILYANDHYAGGTRGKP